MADKWQGKFAYLFFVPFAPFCGYSGLLGVARCRSFGSEFSR
jgi:hypothetical protein